MERTTVLIVGVGIVILSLVFFTPVCDAKVAPGDLDSTFGTGGLVTTDLGGVINEISAIAIDNGGKIVVAGVASVGDTGNDFALARYNTDGSLDATFGTDGKVTTDFNGPTIGPYALAIDSQDRIVVAGNAYIFGTV
jgi:uncharacterized delta-60 repeat protein